MAEALTKKYYSDVLAASAGISPEKNISQHTILVLKEIGIDFSAHQPVSIEKYIHGRKFDYIICLSTKAYQYCKQFCHNLGYIIFWDVEDPMETQGDQQTILSKYREVLFTLHRLIQDFFDNTLTNKD